MSLPHAAPFLFVKPEMLEQHGQLVVDAHWPADNPYIGSGNVPAAIVIETMAQAAAKHGMLGREGGVGVLVQLKDFELVRRIPSESSARVVVKPVRVFPKIAVYRVDLMIKLGAQDVLAASGSMTAAFVSQGK